jgi:hypothetical protein
MESGRGAKLEGKYAMAKKNWQQILPRAYLRVCIV